MSDTDSAILTKPLPDHLVGKNLGQMKLVHEIKKGIFIKKKLYCIIDTNNQEIIKSSGIDSSKLNYKSFLKLLNGESIEIERTKFNVEWKNLNLNVVESKITIKGLVGKVKTMLNTTDVNFKAISFPKKYNLIIHPEYLYTAESVQNNKNKENNIKISTPSVSITSDESDLYLIFSKLEIKIFLIVLFISIIIYLIYFLLIK